MRRTAITLSVLLQVFVLSRLPVFAADASAILTQGLDNANQEAGFQKIDPATLIGRLIQILLGATGIIFLIIIIYAGVMYMMAAGDPGKVEKAKKMITQSIIVLILIVGAYSISTFIISQLKGAA